MLYHESGQLCVILRIDYIYLNFVFLSVFKDYNHNNKSWLHHFTLKNFKVLKGKMVMI